MNRNTQNRTRVTAGRVVALAAVALALAGCGRKQAVEQKNAPPPVVLKGIATETVRQAAHPELLEVPGTVRARTSAVVSPRLPGSVSVLNVREGDRVRKGQLLLQLDARENQASAAAADAAIDEAKRALDEALSRKKLADTTFQRYHNLYNEQAISRQEYDVKQAERDMAAQGAARAESRLRQAQEGAKASTAMADYTKITAPISGIITSKPVDLGASVFPGQPLMTIEDEGSYQLELSLPESSASRVKPGASLRVTLDATGGSFPGRIAEIVPAADPASRTVIAKVNLPSRGLKSGMFGRGAIATGVMVSGITVPKRSLVERGALVSVWIVDKDSTVRMRLVKTGKMIGEAVEVLSGLSDGDRVVVGGLDKVSEGARLE